MSQKNKRRWALFLFAFASGCLTLLAFRSLAGATLAAILSGVSAQAVASAATTGTGKVAGGVHVSAVMGSVGGGLLLWLQLKDVPLREKLLFVPASLLAAYFGGLASAEMWDFGPGGVGVSATVCAYLAVPVLNLLLALLKDLPWIKRLISHRVGAAEAAPDQQQGGGNGQG